jgi:hypothetical protein
MEVPRIPEEVEFTELAKGALDTYADRLQASDNSLSPLQGYGSEQLFRVGKLAGKEVREVVDTEAAYQVCDVLTTNMHPRLQTIFSIAFSHGVQEEKVEEK